jgi:hypothetical protein
LCRPSPVFLTWTIIFAGVPGVGATIVGFSKINAKCDESLALFLIIQGQLGLVWLAFAIYVYVQFSKPYSQNAADDTGPMSR